jgi:hypothetical protein
MSWNQLYRADRQIFSSVLSFPAPKNLVGSIKSKELEVVSRVYLYRNFFKIFIFRERCHISRISGMLEKCQRMREKCNVGRCKRNVERYEITIGRGGRNVERWEIRVGRCGTSVGRYGRSVFARVLVFSPSPSAERSPLCAFVFSPSPSVKRSALCVFVFSPLPTVERYA